MEPVSVVPRSSSFQVVQLLVPSCLLLAHRATDDISKKENQLARWRDQAMSLRSWVIQIPSSMAIGSSFPLLLVYG